MAKTILENKWGRESVLSDNKSNYNARVIKTSRPLLLICGASLLFLFIFLFIFRERVREGERAKQ